MMKANIFRPLRFVRAARATLAEQCGSMTILTTAMLVVSLVVILPMVLNLGAVRTVRRQSQNGSDAAAQAAAEQAARVLNYRSRDIWGCVPPETASSIVRRYVATVVEPIGESGVGGDSAREYAAQNHSTVTSYSTHVHRMGADGVHAKTVSGVVVPPVHVSARVSAPLKGLIVEPMDDLNGYPVPSLASGEAYLDRYRTWKTPCPGNPDAIAIHYQFIWKMRLVKAGW
jgi:hypothetical protein